MPIIRWEILILFFYLTVRDEDGWKEAIKLSIDAPKEASFTLLSNLGKIEDLVDRIHRITLAA